MVRKVTGIIFYTIAGFFIYGAGVLAFINMPDIGNFKFLIMGLFYVPALICMAIAAAVHRSGNWKISTGIALLSAAGVDLFVVVMIISILMSPEAVKLMPSDGLNMFTGYRAGFATMVIHVCAGVWLLVAGRKKRVENKTVIQAGQNEPNHTGHSGWSR